MMSILAVVSPSMLSWIIDIPWLSMAGMAAHMGRMRVNALVCWVCSLLPTLVSLVENQLLSEEAT